MARKTRVMTPRARWFCQSPQESCSTPCWSRNSSPVQLQTKKVTWFLTDQELCVPIVCFCVSYASPGGVMELFKPWQKLSPVNSFPCRAWRHADRQTVVSRPPSTRTAVQCCVYVRCSHIWECWGTSTRPASWRWREGSPADPQRSAEKTGQNTVKTPRRPAEYPGFVWDKRLTPWRPAPTNTTDAVSPSCSQLVCSKTKVYQTKPNQTKMNRTKPNPN